MSGESRKTNNEFKGATNARLNHLETQVNDLKDYLNDMRKSQEKHHEQIWKKLDDVSKKVWIGYGAALIIGSVFAAVIELFRLKMFWR